MGSIPILDSIYFSVETMIKAIVSDLSRTLLHPKARDYMGELNTLHEGLKNHKDYDVWDHYQLSESLFDFYKDVGSKVEIYLFTTKFIQEWQPLEKRLKEVFKEVFCGERLKLKKDDPNSYQVIADKIGFSPSEILFIDDNQTNIQAAKEAGMQVIRFESEDQVLRDFAEKKETFLS